MENTSPKFAVTYGRTDFFAEEGLETLFVASEAEVRDMASQFIQVIPDDLDCYQADIKAWDPSEVLLITHQDDDTFYFSAVPVYMPPDLSKFAAFLSDFHHSGGEDDPEDI